MKGRKSVTKNTLKYRQKSGEKAEYNAGNVQYDKGNEIILYVLVYAKQDKKTDAGTCKKS